MLPDGDGFDLCRRMRKSPNIGGTPVVFLTARSDEVDRVLGLEIGGDDYVTKPFSPRELMARVKAHLRQRRSAIEEQGGFPPSCCGWAVHASTGRRTGCTCATKSRFLT